VALAIVRLFSSGGLQRDCMAIARRLIQRGHDVTIICTEAEIRPPDIKLILLPNKSLSNPDINRRFAYDLHRNASQAFDLIVGFNKIPHLDVLYCADPPIRKPATILDHLTPRIRKYRQLDLSCFGETSRTRILLLAERQLAQYSDAYQTERSRIEVLPPTIDKSRIITTADQTKARAAQRRALDLPDSCTVWLFIGRYPVNKGLDRIVSALGDFPEVRCLCVGFDPASVEHGSLARQAKRTGVANRLRLLGPMDNVPELMAASDLLVHPSRKDVTGTVILEAVANGLPVITTDACGYASHVIRAKAGLVVAEPFSDEAFRLALGESDSPGTRGHWRANALAYAAKEDLSSGLDRAAAAIEKAGLTKLAAS